MSLDYRFCVAPMMKKTDRHFRFLSRQFSKKAILYTEMIHANAILKGNPDKLLQYKDIEHPVALQLGGCEPSQLAEAAEIGASYGYDEINLNVGCPSKKVRSGNFGVFLMKDIKLLSLCLRAMKKNLSIPLTVKCRIGVDEFEGDAFLNNFISRLSYEGIDTFFIHARKAVSGLDTKRNRSIPPLKYETVYRIKENHPDLKIIINGGIDEMSKCQDHLSYVDGVMLGRKIYADPTFLLEVDQQIYGESRKNFFSPGMKAYMEYILNLENSKDVNRAITHLLQIIKKVSFSKNVRKQILSNVRNNKSDLREIFMGFQEDLNLNLQN